MRLACKICLAKLQLMVECSRRAQSLCRNYNTWKLLHACVLLELPKLIALSDYDLQVVGAVQHEPVPSQSTQLAVAHPTWHRRIGGPQATGVYAD